MEGKQTILERFDIDDNVTKAQIYRKWNKAMKRPATHHHTWILVAPSRTFICGCTDFGIYDGTSAFNFLKGFVATYYDGDDKAPLVRPRRGNKELDLKLDPTTVLPDGSTMGSRLGCCVGLKLASDIVLSKSCGRTSDLMNNNRDYYCLCYDVSCKPAPIAPSSYWYSRFPSISEVYVLFFADHELAVVLFICCVQ